MKKRLKIGPGVMNDDEVVSYIESNRSSAVNRREAELRRLRVARMIRHRVQAKLWHTKKRNQIKLRRHFTYACVHLCVKELLDREV